MGLFMNCQIQLNVIMKVLAIVNTPPFNADHYYVLTQENEAVHFDKKQFDHYTQKQSLGIPL